MEVFSTDIHRKKKSFLQAFLLQSERVLERHFLAIWRPKFQKIFLPTLEISHGDSELSKYKKAESLWEKRL